MTRIIQLVIGLSLLARLVPGQTLPSTPDTSANGSLSGNYFVRGVAVANYDPKTGNARQARSIIGVANFDGKGNYTFAGVVLDSKVGTKQQTYNTKGTYSVGGNGAFQIKDLLDTGETDFGGVGAAGPSAFVASAT